MPLISLDIRTLRAFVSVIKTGSITETARQLGRSQPAISLQLQRLEEAVALHEARNDHADDRRHEKRDQHRDERQHQKPSGTVVPQTALHGHCEKSETSRWKTPAALEAAGPSPAWRQATLKSFQRLFMYAASSISVFQHEMFLTRSRNEPPSRTVPAFSIGMP